ncbi:tyrosine-type recombinase/integrase [Psychrobacillus lasiicapitis]|uniref:Integrase n=1 Tax=Psychrobacillus lasiicapitis TaxID=1636719 RepID=A0A544T1Z3_9BACI|nr:tyrosine-type recombinase/integrase [Psychrobacillus lasiicapitis]TQR11430.1 hypothetical protein FG382_15920 [Psychrobacillus lasiicapitis]GGA40605.1 tyrosine recombinase XerC [Psychrobacillus lasiicapitis]
MGKKISLTADLKKLLNESGIDHTDFLAYLTKTPVENKNQSEEQTFTVLHIIDDFISMLNRNEFLKIKSKDTMKYYLSFLKRFKNYIEDKYIDLPFKDLNEIIFYNFINDTSTTNLKHSSINTYIRVIKKLCTFANENDYCSKNFGYKFKFISYSTLPRYFSKSQLESIFSETKKHKKPILWQTIFITFVGSGLRIHELSKLRISDIDFEGNSIHTIGKGNKERYIPLYPFVKKALLEYLKISGVTDFFSAKDGYLFSRLHGNNRDKPVSIRSIQENFQKIIEPINLDSRFTVHSFRHTFAVNCLKANMQLIYLTQILGHRSPSTTIIYTKLVPKDLQKVVNEKYPFPLEKLIEHIFSVKDGI